MRKLSLHSWWWLLGAGAIILLAWSFMPQPISVEVASVGRGPMQLTIDEDGRTRVRHRYVVSAPVSGHLARIVLRPGDRVMAGQIVATVLPAAPVPIDARTRTQLEARVAAAIDGLKEAKTRADAARVTLEQADRELGRQVQLERDRVVSAQELDTARTRQRTAAADVDVAMSAIDVAEHDVEAARAALLESAKPHDRGHPLPIRAPKAGSVLKIIEESERPIQAGSPLMEIGAAAELEIVADLLSTDAVQVQPGAKVRIDRWGGEGTLNGRVRTIEPSSFTKVSALGVEEQRVNVLIDFADAPSLWQRLGDGFAVEVQIVVWDADDVLKVPTNTLFRSHNQWSVYKVVDGRALEQQIRIARQNDRDALVDSGLVAGDRVIVHPSERISTGTRVVIR